MFSVLKDCFPSEMMPNYGVKVINNEYTSGDCALKTSMISSQSSSCSVETTPIHYPAASMEVDVVDGIEFLAWESLDDLNRYCVKVKYMGKEYERSNGPIIKRKRSSKSKKTSLAPKHQKVKHEIYNDLACNPIVSTHRLECLYKEYVDESIRAESKNKPKYILSPTMDENYVHNSLRALDSSLIKSRSTISTCGSSTTSITNGTLMELHRQRFNGNCNIRSSSTSSSTVATTPIAATANIKKEKISANDDEIVKYVDEDRINIGSPNQESDADITEMISRHSKREIRLPARYHQSGFLMGTQWVIPDYESTDKTSSSQGKRLKIAENNDHTYSLSNHQNLSSQSSLILPTSSSPSNTLSTSCSYYLIKPLNSCENQRLSTSSKHSQATSTPILSGKRNSASNSRNIDGHVKRSISTESVNTNITTATTTTTTNHNSNSNHNNSNNSRNSESGGELLNKVNVCKNNPSHSYQFKLHQEKLEKIQKLKQSGISDGSKDEQPINGKNNNNNIHTSSKINSRGNSSTGSCKKVITPYSRLSASSSRHSSSSCSASGANLSSPLKSSSKISPIKNDNNNNMIRLNHSNFNNTVTNIVLDPDSKDAKLKELREAYRLLFFENKPERKQEYLKTRIKPRVNKKAAVEEAIKTIENLTKKEKTLEYFKKLLTMWNRKLTIAAKVINDKGKHLSNKQKLVTL